MQKAARKENMGKAKVLLAGNSEMVIFKFRLELIEELVRRGYEVYVSFPVTEFGDGQTIATKYGCTFIDTPISSHGTNPATDIKLLMFYRKMLKKIHPDMIFTYTIKPNIYLSLAARQLGIPVVANVSGLGTAVEEPGILQLVTTTLYRWSTKGNQTVFFQNTENEHFFAARHIADGKRKLLPGSGVNLERFQVLPYPQTEQIHFLFMARVMQEKGIDQYIEAAKAIHKKYPYTVFHVLGVCGEEKYRPVLERLTQEGVICYEGQQKDVLPFQKISACTVHPTYYPEGMSNVLLESAACGRPIITTDRSGCREIIDDGVNGYVCKQKDAQDLIKQIEKFLALPWEQRRDMGLAGRAKVEREFDRKIVVDAYLEELERALQTKVPV